jgi:hypothetical protein
LRLLYVEKASSRGADYGCYAFRLGDLRLWTLVDVSQIAHEN